MSTTPMKTKKAQTLPVPTRRRDLGFKPVDRWWFVTDTGTLVRGISWTNYEQVHYPGGDMREFTMLLAPNDPRPLGRRILCRRDVFSQAYVRSMAEWYQRTHPKGVWVELLSPCDAPPYRDSAALWVPPSRKEHAA